MVIKFRKIFILVGWSIALVLIVIALFDMKEKETSINEYKFETVGKVYKFDSNRSFSYYYYIYNYKEKEYEGYQDNDSFGGEDCVNKFYKLNLSTINPEYSKIFLDQEVTDSTEIVNAGFKYEPPQEE
jgi:hypothetical protein